MFGSGIKGGLQIRIRIHITRYDIHLVEYDAWIRNQGGLRIWIRIHIKGTVLYPLGTAWCLDPESSGSADPDPHQRYDTHLAEHDMRNKKIRPTTQTDRTDDQKYRRVLHRCKSPQTPLHCNKVQPNNPRNCAKCNTVVSTSVTYWPS